MPDELLDVIHPETEEVIGQAPRSLCHGDPSLVHRAVHAAVLHPDGKRILLQKRSPAKRIQPGKWDMSVGGHLASGEEWEDALLRETGEELGLHVSPDSFRFLFRIRERNRTESENIRVYLLYSEGPFLFPPEEISETAFFAVSALLERIRNGCADDLTPLLRRELPLVAEATAL